MVDLAHTTYPNYEQGDYYKGPCQVRLALESEFGRYRNPDESFAKVLEDAAKVAAFRADVKVVVFASQDGEDVAEIAGALEQLRRQAADTTPWLWADVPWEAGKAGAWRPSHGILG